MSKIKEAVYKGDYSVEISDIRNDVMGKIRKEQFEINYDRGSYTISWK